MNLQHLIDQHPAAFAAVFPTYFLCLWFLVASVVSFVGGWFSLARLYRTRVPFIGSKWREQSGQMRCLTNYNRVLTLGTSQEDLYLASMFLFRFMHPPLLIPWSEINVRRKKGWVFELRDLYDGVRPGNPFADSRLAGGEAPGIGGELLAY